MKANLLCNQKSTIYVVASRSGTSKQVYVAKWNIYKKNKSATSVRNHKHAYLMILIFPFGIVRFFLWKDSSYTADEDLRLITFLL